MLSVLHCITFTYQLNNTAMITAKQVILTAIHLKGIAQVKSELKQLAENLLCSEAYVSQVIKKVEKGHIIIKGA